MTRMLSLCFALCLLSPINANAQEIPRFDVEGYCQKLASLGGSLSQNMLEYCINQEQGAYNSLKNEWHSYPQSIRQHCEKVNSVLQIGSYEMLSFCMKDEMQSYGRNATKKFKF